MTVKELKEKLSLLNDDAEIILDCHDIHGARINSNFGIQTNTIDFYFYDRTQIPKGFLNAGRVPITITVIE